MVGRFLQPLALVTVACAVTASVSDAQIYKWVDGNGTVHFSSDPPARTASKKVEVIGTDEPQAPMVQGAPELTDDGEANAAADGDLTDGEPDGDPAVVEGGDEPFDTGDDPVYVDTGPGRIGRDEADPIPVQLPADQPLDRPIRRLAR